MAVTATNDLALNALAGAVTISTQANGNGLAGSFAYNQLGGATSAYIDGATLRNTGATRVEATVDGKIKTLSASVQASRGKVGVQSLVEQRALFGIELLALLAELQASQLGDLERELRRRR